MEACPPRSCRTAARLAVENEECSVGAAPAAPYADTGPDGLTGRGHWIWDRRLRPRKPEAQNLDLIAHFWWPATLSRSKPRARNLVYSPTLLLLLLLSVPVGHCEAARSCKKASVASMFQHFTRVHTQFTHSSHTVHGRFTKIHSSFTKSSCESSVNRRFTEHSQRFASI